MAIRYSDKHDHAKSYNTHNSEYFLNYEIYPIARDTYHNLITKVTMIIVIIMMSIMFIIITIIVV